VTYYQRYFYYLKKKPSILNPSAPLTSYFIPDHQTNTNETFSTLFSILLCAHIGATAKGCEPILKNVSLRNIQKKNYIVYHERTIWLTPIRAWM